eukprot:5311434-Prymnesium_polylepis.1
MRRGEQTSEDAGWRVHGWSCGRCACGEARVVHAARLVDLGQVEHQPERKVGDGRVEQHVAVAVRLERLERNLRRARAGAGRHRRLCS